MITLFNVLLDSKLHNVERLLLQSYCHAPRFSIKCVKIYTSHFFGVQFVCMWVGFQKVLVVLGFFYPLGTFNVQAKCLCVCTTEISSLWKVLLDRNMIAEQTNIDFLRIFI